MTKYVAALCLIFAAGSTPSFGQSLSDAFRALSADTRWTQVEAIPLAIDTHHPQGLTRAGERWILSSVEVVDRAKGKGAGHLFAFDDSGALTQHVQFGEGGIYHPGGIDFDGEAIWMSVAEYRPDSSSIVYRVDPRNFELEEMFRFSDHLGAIAHLPERSLLIGVSWGARRIYRWSTARENGSWVVVDAEIPVVVTNPVHYVDYQDVQVVDAGLLLASGVKTYRQRGARPFTLGGMDLLDARSGTLVHSVPVTLTGARGTNLSQNPFYVEMREGAVRWWAAPEDNETTLYLHTPR